MSWIYEGAVRDTGKILLVLGIVALMALLSTCLLSGSVGCYIGNHSIAQQEPTHEITRDDINDDDPVFSTRDPKMFEAWLIVNKMERTDFNSPEGQSLCRQLNERFKRDPELKFRVEVAIGLKYPNLKK